jgi:hypothetical protein
VESVSRVAVAEVQNLIMMRAAGCVIDIQKSKGLVRPKVASHGLSLNLRHKRYKDDHDDDAEFLRTMMDLPPGPLHLLRLLLRNLPTTITWCVALRFLAFYLGVVLPTWLVISMVLFIQTVAMSYYVKYRHRNEARVNGAVMVPEIKGGAFTVMQKLVKSMQSGYPGESFHDGLGIHHLSNVILPCCSLMCR